MYVKKGELTGIRAAFMLPEPKNRPSAVRAHIVALKRGNSCGAKVAQEGG
jgi:hypothetical protein